MSTAYSAASRSGPSGAKIVAMLASALTVLAFAPVLQAQSSPESERATSRSLVNQARTAAGQRSLAAHAGADAMAQDQAQRMADRDVIFHNPNLGADADARGVDWKAIGENVGVGRDAQMVHEGFMNSRDHRANVTHAEYTILGVGAARGKDGSIFIAHVFASLRSTAAAPDAPKAAPPPSAGLPAASPDRVSTGRSETAPGTPVPVATEPVVPPRLNAVEGGVVDREVVFG